MDLPGLDPWDPAADWPTVGEVLSGAASGPVLPDLAPAAVDDGPAPKGPLWALLGDMWRWAAHGGEGRVWEAADRQWRSVPRAYCGPAGCDWCRKLGAWPSAR